jgi:ketosteroid isomerase-like protein
MKTVLCIVIGCIICSAQTQPPQKPNKEMSAFLKQLADTRKTIADGYVQWTEAAKTGNIDALAGMYANDATVLPDEKDAVSGKDAIRAFYGDWLAQRGKLIELKFENINSVQQNDLLIDCTKFSGVFIKEGKEIAFKGNRLVVWKREFQGPWKIVRDTWNKSLVP